MKNTESADSCREWQVQGGWCSPGARLAVMRVGFLKKMIWFDSRESCGRLFEAFHVDGPVSVWPRGSGVDIVGSRGKVF